MFDVYVEHIYFDNALYLVNCKFILCIPAEWVFISAAIRIIYTERVI